jgi:hypothetical protein
VIRPWLELARISNLPTVWTNVLAGWLLAGGIWDWSKLSWLLLGGSLLYTAGMILNDAADVKFDREHRQERPIPSGKVSLTTAWSVGLAMLLSGFALVVWMAGACIWLTGALVVCIVAYDLYHKPWPGSVFIMGSCRTLLYAVAASGVTGSLSFEENHEVIVKGIALGGYVVGISLIARNESNAQNSPRGKTSLLPSLVGALGLILPLLGGVWYAGLHEQWVPVVFAISLGAVIFSALSLMKESNGGIGKSVGMLLAAMPMVDALALSGGHLMIAILFLAAMPSLLLWQRKIAAT